MIEFGSPIVEVPLGSEGWAFFLDRVGKLGGVLARRILDRPDPQKGRLVALVPEEGAEDVRARLAQGFWWSLPGGSGPHEKAAAEWVTGRLRRERGVPFLAVMDSVHDVLTPYLRSFGVPAWTRGEQVWWFALDQAATDPGEILSVMRQACSGFGAVGFAGAVPAGVVLPAAFEPLTDEAVSLLTAGVRLAMAVAFDEEGFLCWEDAPDPG